MLKSRTTDDIQEAWWASADLRSERGRSLWRGSPGRHGAGRWTVQRQKAGQVTVAGTRRREQEQKAGQVLGDPSGTECWRVEHDMTTIWQRVSVEELIKRRPGDRADWGP